ncbi:hypothetical protein BN1723_014992 [Verticillium longisporum]|uniref:beta-glucosidase n=1 Tax=Verticillium longisporum TaxID=100787 RepID=A0A0G4MN89_VERLO|nr:hypothetical protein BN1723_014992 [Verticillium longisporum]
MATARAMANVPRGGQRQTLTGLDTYHQYMVQESRMKPDPLRIQRPKARLSSADRVERPYAARFGSFSTPHPTGHTPSSSQESNIKRPSSAKADSPTISTSDFAPVSDQTTQGTPVNSRARRAIKERAAQDNALVQQWLNNTLIINSNVTDLWVPTPPEVCLVFLKTWAEEAVDRQHLDVDWNGNEVVESVAKDCNNTIVITHSSGINTLPFAKHPNVTAIVAAHFPGQESGHSLVDVLYGDVNPSGKLPYTIANNGSDYNAPPTTAINTTGVYDWQSWFEEKLEIDYRYFDAHNISVLYEFGFGLSYTTFEMADLQAEPLATDITSRPADVPILPGGNPELWGVIYNVTLSVTNTGDVDGAAIPQLYVSFADGATPAGTPVRQLRGFEKVPLAAGETKTVQFGLMRRDLSYWDISAQQWLLPEGEITLSAGFSSRDLHEGATITPVQA